MSSISRVYKLKLYKNTKHESNPSSTPTSPHGIANAIPPIRHASGVLGHHVSHMLGFISLRLAPRNPSSSRTTSSMPNPMIQLWRMQQASTSFTCVLYVWNGLLSRIRNLFFSAPKALSTITLRDECLRLNNSLALVG